MDCLRLRGGHAGGPVSSYALTLRCHLGVASDTDPEHVQPFEVLAGALLRDSTVEKDIVDDHSCAGSRHRGHSSRPRGLQRTPLVTQDHFPVRSVREQR